MRYLPPGAVAVALVIAACTHSPLGTPQLNLVSDSDMNALGEQAFAEAKAETPETKDAAVTQYVRCVASAIAAEVAPGQQWDVRVFESPQVNAFALPGGRIGVYTGLLKVAEDQDQLATVLAHEVAHVTANHSKARVSAAYASQAGVQLTSALLGGNAGANPQLLNLLGAGVQYGVLMPYGRGQETEADLIGLDSMAKAGFDPRASVKLWENMSKASGGKEPPTFLSTHPSNEGRIDDLNERMPRALKLYEQAQAAGRRPNCPQPGR